MPVRYTVFFLGAVGTGTIRYRYFISLSVNVAGTGISTSSVGDPDLDSSVLLGWIWIRSDQKILLDLELDP
jgi:hypothetical protein